MPLSNRNRRLRSNFRFGRSIRAFTASMQTHFWDQIHQVQPNNAAHEYYLTDMVEILSSHGFPGFPLHRGG